MRLTTLVAAATFAMSAAHAATTYEGNGQVPQQFVLSGKAADRLHDHISVNLETAENLVAACQAIARKSNSAVVVVVLDAQGLPVLVSRGDGEGLVQVTATQQKTLTALRTRAPSHVLTNRNVQDPFTSQNMTGYGLTAQKGGLPIIVNGQLIGAMGAGGMGTAPAERCTAGRHREGARQREHVGNGDEMAAIGQSPDHTPREVVDSHFGGTSARWPDLHFANRRAEIHIYRAVA
jgi:glc operon protein GlcG